MGSIGHYRTFNKKSWHASELQSYVLRVYFDMEHTEYLAILANGMIRDCVCIHHTALCTVRDPYSLPHTVFTVTSHGIN